ncbi:long-chain fatty acid--CoA ligase [candidate division TA06 bacterium]|uniref:Long-chain fatty acid--CoA ligase n=1 Tax=candidate division TA06 bacterium TaxID=2250710 RepID=A0A523XTB9_UNCT6|nr:MAG: long-chain fatty acid--CoA ligase [candidate division TA06 bacterium]
MGVPWLNLGEILVVNSKKYRNKLALKERDRALTFGELNVRTNQLANALVSMGLKKGEKVSCLLENSIEIVELYLAAAKTGMVLNPINFRLSPSDVEYIVGDSDAKAIVAHEEFTPCIDEIRGNLPNVRNFVSVGEETPPGYINYESLLAESSDDEPRAKVNPEDNWVLLYTSGTTGKPKGVVRSHESYVAFYLINAIDFGFSEHDVCLNIMPLSHVNSTFFSFTFTYIGGSLYIHPSSHFDPVEILEIIQREKITFISLIPTHYNLILNVPEEERREYDVSSIKKLLCSSAPARKEMKKAVMEMFKGVELYEGYGSTEAGIVTVLKPYEQMTKLGSIGRESCGTSMIKILDEQGNPVPVGQVGELYSRGPMLFDKYHKLPEKTEESFREGWFTAGDMAKEDEEGYFYIVDRKDNLVITGGEHVYPSEVEEVVARHPAVFDVAVIGVPHEKWGEAVKAVVILKQGKMATEQEIIKFCVGKMASFKKPKSVTFIEPEEMPRTGTGKILHRELHRRFTKNKNQE